MTTVISSSLVLSDVESGGGVINGNNPVIGYHNLVTGTNITTTTESTSYPAINLANVATYLKWQGTDDSSDEYITMDLQSVDDVDYVGVAKHNWFTQQITVSLEAFNGSTWDEVVQEFIPPTDEALIMRFTPQGITQLRIRLQPGLDVPEASVVYAGKLLVMQRRLYVGVTPVNMARVAQVVNGRSESGNFLGRIVRNEALKLSVQFQNLTPSWYRTYLDPFIRASKDVPFFFAWRPGTYPYEVGYCWLMGDPIPSNQSSNGNMRISFDIGGIAS